LRVSGWLGENNLPFFEEQKRTLAAAGLLESSKDHRVNVIT